MGHKQGCDSTLMVTFFLLANSLELSDTVHAQER
jgi:hypothetical protein